MQWKLPKGAVYDDTYLHRFIDDNQALLPEGVGIENIVLDRDCLKAVIAVRFIIDATQDLSRLDSKLVPCEEGSSKKK